MKVKQVSETEYLVPLGGQPKNAERDASLPTLADNREKARTALREAIDFLKLKMDEMPEDESMPELGGVKGAVKMNIDGLEAAFKGL